MPGLPRPRPLGLPREVLILSASGFFVAVGFGVMVPVLPVFAQQFGVNTLQIGLVISGFSLMRLVAGPFTGWIIRAIGERLAIALGMFWVGVTTAVAGAATSYEGLLLWRALSGIGSAVFTVAAISLLLSSVPMEKRGQASGLYQGGFLLGGMAGPAIGGLLGAFSLAAPFYFYGASMLVAGVFILVMIRQARAGTVTGELRKPRPMREVVRDVGYQAACVSGFGQGWQSFGARSALVPLLVVGSLGLTSNWTGIAFSIAAVAQSLALLPVGRAVDTVGRRPLMIAAGVITGAATLTMPFAPNIWVLIGALCVYGVGASMQGTAPTAAVGDAARGGSGTPIAVFSMTTDLGAIMGPLIAGAIADTAWGMPGAFALGAAILFLGAVYASFMPRRLPSAPDAL